MNINYVVLKEGVSLDEVAEKVAYLCEYVKTYHSDTGFYGGFVALNTGGGQQLPFSGQKCKILA